MAACGSLEHIFDKPLQPQTPTTLLESLSPWKRIRSIGSSSFTELFGELHFKESHGADDAPPELTSSSSSPFPLSSIGDDYVNPPQDNTDIRQGQNRSSTGQHGRVQSFSSMNSDSLSLCTEGLGFESFDDVEDLLNSNSSSGNIECNNDERNHQEESRNPARNSLSRRSRTHQLGAFPPPISCIGRNGKPWVYFKSYRRDGRFILKEVRIPTQEFLHACREDGRLRLQCISDDEFDLHHHYNEEEGSDEDEDDDVEEEEESIGEGSTEDNVETT